MGVQVGLDSLGTPLEDIEWIVIDLETTGIGARASITEIGAVRTRDERTVDEFHTLVDPEEPISPRITALTGITTSMVTGAPTIDRAYPDFARWAGLEDKDGHLCEPRSSRVFVAHNAPFDMGFLRRAARSCGHGWPRPPVLDTLTLARVALPRPMVRNHKLQTLASYFQVAPQDQHRALGDARTTVGVLHGLLSLMAPVGVSTLEDVTTVASPVPTRRRHRSGMADSLPRSPGVYRFVDASGAPLYVGSATNLRSRVRSYFTASESRARVRRMLDLAADVLAEPTSTVLEARVNELRSIRTLHPLFNSASTHQDTARWVVRHGDRLEVVPALDVDDAPAALGPYRGTGHATRALDALCATYPVDGSTMLSAAGRIDDLSRPRIDAALRGEHCEVVDALAERMSAASDLENFEAAARWRGELSAYVAGLQRRSSVLPVASARRIVWARHRDEGGWVLHAASWGSLTRTLITPARTSPTPWVDALLEEDPLPEPRVFLAWTTWEEVRLLTDSLLGEGTRLVTWDGPVDLSEPVDSPLSRTQLVDRLDLAHVR